MDILMFGWETPFVFQYGGLGTFGKEVVNALVKLGHKVMWCGAVPPGYGMFPRRMFEGRYLAIPVSEVHDLGKGDVAAIRAACSMYSKMLADAADVVVTNDMHVVTALDAALSYGVPAVHLMHTVSGDPIEAGYVIQVGKGMTNSVAVRDAVASFISAVASMVRPSPPTPDIHVTYFPPPEVGPPNDALVTEYRRLACGGDPEDAVVVGTLSRAQDFKNTKLVDAVVKGLRGRGLNAYGLIGGAGRKEGRAGRHTVCVGYVPESRKGSFYKALDVFLLTSLFEPYGLTALEAISSGTPAVLSATSGVAEVLGAPVADPRKPREYIEVVHNTIMNREEVLKRQRERVSKLPSWEVVAQKIISIACDSHM